MLKGVTHLPLQIIIKQGRDGRGRALPKYPPIRLRATL